MNERLCITLQWRTNSTAFKVEKKQTPVIVIDQVTGERTRHDSAADADEAYGFDSGTAARIALAGICHLGRYDVERVSGDKAAKPKKENIGARGRPVLVIDALTGITTRYETGVDAANAIGVAETRISSSKKRGGVIHGRWMVSEVKP